MQCGQLQTPGMALALGSSAELAGIRGRRAGTTDKGPLATTSSQPSVCLSTCEHLRSEKCDLCWPRNDRLLHTADKDEQRRWDYMP